MNQNRTINSRLLPLCPTRQTVQARVLNAVLRNYEAVMESLDQLSYESGSTGAEGLLDNMKIFECFFGIRIAYEVFPVTKQLATALKSKIMT